jgi:hypothetical protein
MSVFDPFEPFGTTIHPAGTWPISATLFSPLLHAHSLAYPHTASKVSGNTAWRTAFHADFAAQAYGLPQEFDD